MSVATSMGSLRRWLIRTVAALALILAGSQALAVCAGGACVSAGPRLASVDSTRGVLLNALMGRLLDSSISLSALDWQNVARADVNLLGLLRALQAQTRVASPSEALDAQASLVQIVNAAASVATAGGNSAAAAALNLLSPQLGPIVQTIRLRDLLQVNLQQGALASSTINLLELVSGSFQLFNHRNVFTTPTPVSLTGAAVGLGGLLQNVDLYAQVIEPPVYVCGPTGATFNTAAIRVKLNLHLITIYPNTSNLVGILGIVDASASVVDLELYVELGRANGTLASIDALARSVSVQATPGVAALYLGNISDSVFFNRSAILNPATHLNHATIGALSVNLGGLGTLNVAIQAKAYGNGQSPSASTLRFSSPYPQTRSAYTSAGFVDNLLADLLSHLELRLQPSLGEPLNSTVVPLLTSSVASALSPVLAPILTGLVDPLLHALGVRLGEVDVTVSGATALCAITGSVYSDANHNATRDGAEAGCGFPLYAKLVADATPTEPASAVALVDATTGNFSFAQVPAGSYRVVINSQALASAVTPETPAGWLPTQSPTLVRNFNVVATEVVRQDFGLFHGSKVAGQVFRDNGSGAGIANNGVPDGTESGIAGAGMRAMDAGGATTFDSTSSSASGAFLLWIPFAAGNNPVLIVSGNAPGHVSVGGGAGTTGGSYDRSTDRVLFTNVPGSSYSALLFADVPDNSLSNDHQQLVLPGAIAYFPHVYRSGSAGRLAMAVTATASPAQNWGQVIYRDTNCNGRVDDTDVVLAAAVDMVADQALCIVIKISAPVAAPYNSRHTLTLGASFAYANNTLERSLQRGDLTIVGDATDAGLVLTKSVDKASALPGDMIRYAIRFDNLGNKALANLQIHDATPVHTVFVAARCNILGAGLSSCLVTQAPGLDGVGPIRWTFGGTLTPGAGGTIEFDVRIP